MYVAKLVGESRFDLVLTDLQMPSADGFGVLEAVRGVDPGLKVVAVSARGDLGAADFAARGFAGCLRKPFTYSELVAAIRAACGSGEIVPQGGDPEIPSADGADFTALTAYAGDDPEAARSILRSFAEQTAGNCAELERALGEGDAATVKTLAHKMLPIFTMLGAAEVAETLRRGETCEGPLPEALCGELRAAARTALEAGGFSLVLSDMRLPDEDGIALLQWMAGAGVAAPVIVMTSYAEIQNAVRCMKLGARDYVAKPVNPDELLKKIREALDVPAVPAAKSASKPAPRAAGSFSEQPLNYIEGRSDAARQLYEHIRLVAPTNMSVLVNGASGTGKEHVAQLIHRESKRAGKPFVAVDCGAIPRDLAASEFFGHVKGAFTGALADKTGAFEAADGGTLFLDEVGNLGYETQVQLLRALQERRIRPVGSNREIPVDIRLVAATNEDLEAAIARGTFRADLYHRINSFTLRMPCLRQMRGDIPLFADFFLDQANRELDKRIVGFDAAAAAALAAYDWPGNLRQLKNAVMSATLLAAGEYITCRDLPAEVTGGPAEPAEAPLSLRDPASEEEQIRRALATAGGNKSQAAKLLGIDRKTLYNKLHLYGIE